MCHFSLNLSIFNRVNKSLRLNSYRLFINILVLGTPRWLSSEKSPENKCLEWGTLEIRVAFSLPRSFGAVQNFVCAFFFCFVLEPPLRRRAWEPVLWQPVVCCCSTAFCVLPTRRPLYILWAWKKGRPDSFTNWHKAMNCWIKQNRKHTWESFPVRPQRATPFHPPESLEPPDPPEWTSRTFGTHNLGKHRLLKYKRSTWALHRGKVFKIN